MNSIANTAGVRALHIGVMAPDGTYSGVDFKAESKSAPLVAVISGAETDGSDDQPEPPTYNPDCTACLRGRDHTAQEHEQALVRNYAASLGDDYDPDAPMCQDDYEFFTKTGIYASGEMTLGDEIYGGE